MDEETLAPMQHVTDPREVAIEVLGKLSPSNVPDMRERGIEVEAPSI